MRIALVPLAAAALLLLAAGPAAADGSPRGMLAHFAGVDPGRVVAVAGYTVEGAATSPTSSWARTATASTSSG